MCLFYHVCVFVSVCVRGVFINLLNGVSLCISLALLLLLLFLPFTLLRAHAHTHTPALAQINSHTHAHNSHSFAGFRFASCCAALTFYAHFLGRFSPLLVLFYVFHLAIPNELQKQQQIQTQIRVRQ